MKKFDQINVIPFIDIMLVLLAIVLMTASFISQGKIEVTVPQSASKQKLVTSDTKLLLTIDKTGQFYKNGETVTEQQMKTFLATLEKSQKITLKVDAETAFQDFVRLTDLLSENELKKIAVVTAKPDITADTTHEKAEATP